MKRLMKDQSAAQRVAMPRTRRGMQTASAMKAKAKLGRGPMWSGFGKCADMAWKFWIFSRPWRRKSVVGTMRRRTSRPRSRVELEVRKRRPGMKTGYMGRAWGVAFAVGEGEGQPAKYRADAIGGVCEIPHSARTGGARGGHGTPVPRPGQIIWTVPWLWELASCYGVNLAGGAF